jgi:pimeloyl-ACP methyl ester carboxylesterase
VPDAEAPIRRIAKFVLWTVVVLLTVICLAAAGFRVAAAWRETADAAALAPASGKFVPTRSGRVFIQEAGPRDGVPVVLFHGTAAWSELWRATMTALAGAGFRAIALDIPPFGFSDRPGTYTRTDQAARVRDVLAALDLPPAIIVGHSFGAGAAVETVLRAPERVRGLVLIDAALGLTATQEASPPALMQYGFLRDTVVSASVTNPLLTRTLLATLIEKKERAALYVELLQRPMVIRHTTHDLGVWLVYFLGSDRDALSAQRANYSRINTKVAILWGEKDGVTPRAQADDLRALMPSASLTLLPGLGHIPQIEDPDAFNRALVAQLAGMK